MTRRRSGTSGRRAPHRHHPLRWYRRSSARIPGTPSAWCRAVVKGFDPKVEQVVPPSGQVNDGGPLAPAKVALEREAWELSVPKAWAWAVRVPARDASSPRNHVQVLVAAAAGSADGLESARSADDDWAKGTASAIAVRATST